MLELADSNREDLRDYVLRQLRHFFPDGRRENELPTVLNDHLDEALARVGHCINAVRMWPENRFDRMHSSQYALFLYYLSNTIWRRAADRDACTRLFFLNKALNGIDCFYEIELPPVMFIGHSVGIVLAKATYGNHLVLYQNSTVGKSHGVAPVIGDGVILYPNTAIIGACHVRDGSVIAQGVSVINRETPGNCLVFQGEAGALVFRKPGHDILGDIFRR